MSQQFTQPITGLGRDAVACANCRYFAPPPPHEQDLIKKGIGECHRFPPKTDYVLVGLEDAGEGEPKAPQFSRMIHNDLAEMSNWCGEYSRKPLGQLPKKVGR